MTKAHLAAGSLPRVHVQGGSRRLSQIAVSSIIADALAGGETFTITGFGIFSTKSRPARSPGPQSPHRRDHRHRSLDRAVVQDGQDRTRRRQLGVEIEAHLVALPDYGSSVNSIRKHYCPDAETT